MSEKRRDNKNRILRMGESQDPDGRYRFRYVDPNGRRKSIYSWRLVATDTAPQGKRDKGPLRDQERSIIRDIEDYILPDGGGLTTLQLVKKYTAMKTGVKKTTKAGYGTVIKLLEKEPFGDRRIDRVRLSDAKAWLIKLQQVDKKSFSSIHAVRGVLKPAFQMAVDDDILRKNPFDFKLQSILINDAVTREAISKKQEETFLEFVRNDTHFCRYYDGMYILFKTGMRISEFAGLTVSDIDLEERTVNIDHQLQKTGSTVYIDSTKTYAGTRILPMQDDVYEAFRRILSKRPKRKVEPMIDGYSGFLFLDKDGKPMVAMHWEKYFKHAVDKYNSIYKDQLPRITPHVCRHTYCSNMAKAGMNPKALQVCRHTYCSNMAKAGMNPKALQYLMGHADIGVTLNTYTHLKIDDAREELLKLAQKQEDADKEIQKLGMRKEKGNIRKFGKMA